MPAIDIYQDLAPSLYHALLEDIWPMASHISLTVRDGQRGHARVVECLQQFAPFLIAERQVQQWPGTKLLWGAHASLFTYPANSQIRQFILRYPITLFGWSTLNLPEDLAVYRSDGSVLMMTVSHEKWGQVLLADGEVERVRGEWLAHVGSLPAEEEYE